MNEFRSVQHIMSFYTAHCCEGTVRLAVQMVVTQEPIAARASHRGCDTQGVRYHSLEEGLPHLSMLGIGAPKNSVLALYYDDEAGPTDPMLCA